MKSRLILLFTLTIASVINSCTEKQEISSINPVNWENRMLNLPQTDSLRKGMTYLSVYSEVYSLTEHRSQDLTATVSMRNTNRTDTIYINRAEYYDTSGKLIRTYIKRPVFVAPMETVEIIIDENDKMGGSGANFLFDWTIKDGVHEPLFEAVMISTAGSLGLSFVTEGKRLE